MPRFYLVFVCRGKKGFWCSKVCMQSRLFSIVYISKFVSSYNSDTTEKLLKWGRPNYTFKSLQQKILFFTFENNSDLMKALHINVHTREYSLLLLHVESTSHISAALKADMFLGIDYIDWPLLVHFNYN